VGARGEQDFVNMYDKMEDSEDEGDRVILVLFIDGIRGNRYKLYNMRYHLTYRELSWVRPGQG